ncbi:sensor histidine kinase [Plastorhodobacter daqingensis]|uniref:histidine kinase n=1 Tax=Plastorhodobacter daqingensis TaxID=1387281 RepID=A0ABW2UG71_9RHOB
MTGSASHEGIGLDLEFLSEPALIVTVAGEVLGANSSARRLFAPATEIPSLFTLLEESEEEVRSYLRRASGSTTSLVGAMTVVAAGGAPTRFRTLAARLRARNGLGAALILRLLSVHDDQFSILNRRIREVDQQLRQRLKENALLQEALADNRVLVRELQHRVKNNVQQMLSLIRMSGAKDPSPGVAEVIATASRRLQAMAAIQEALYQNAGASTVSAADFLGQVVEGAALSCGAADRVQSAIPDVPMTAEKAHCLALIANELVTNACKHGLNGAVGGIRVSLAPEGAGLRLDVQDDGPGFEEGTTARSSGLTLVRALCRQIGARLEIVNEQGARCSVHFQSGLSAPERQ